MFENFIFCELKAYLDFKAKRDNIYFWRIQNSSYEVDFVFDDLEIQVKTSRNIISKDCKGLKAIQEEKDFKFRIIVCYEECSRLTTDGILIINWKKFLLKLWSGNYI